VARTGHVSEWSAHTRHEGAEGKAHCDSSYHAPLHSELAYAPELVGVPAPDAKGALDAPPENRLEPVRRWKA